MVISTYFTVYTNEGEKPEEIKKRGALAPRFSRLWHFEEAFCLKQRAFYVHAGCQRAK